MSALEQIRKSGDWRDELMTVCCSASPLPADVKLLPPEGRKARLFPAAERSSPAGRNGSSVWRFEEEKPGLLGRLLTQKPARRNNRKSSPSSAWKQPPGAGPGRHMGSQQADRRRCRTQTDGSCLFLSLCLLLLTWRGRGSYRMASVTPNQEVKGIVWSQQRTSEHCDGPTALLHLDRQLGGLGLV